MIDGPLVEPTATVKTPGVVGSATMSVMIPASDRVQVDPLLSDFHRPVWLAAKSVVVVVEPADAGSITSFPIRLAVPLAEMKVVAPSCVHVAPPFVERKTPHQIGRAHV